MQRKPEGFGLVAVEPLQRAVVLHPDKRLIKQVR